MRGALAALGASLLLATGAPARELPVGPDALAGSHWLRAPVFDPIPPCEPPEPDGACGEIERARRALQEGRLEEAAAAAVRATRLEPDGAHAESASFQRAEAMYRARWLKQAAPLYEALARSKNARLAAAARLRQADLRFEDDPASAHTDYEQLLGAAESFGADAVAWAPRAGESALAAGAPAAARAWLERSVRSAPSKQGAAEARVRIADCFLAEDQLGRALAQLASVAEEQGEAPIGALARLRMLELKPESAHRSQQSRTFLRAQMAASSPALSVYAAALLARSLVASGELDEALDVLSRSSSQRVPPGLARLVTDVYDVALQAALAGGADSEAACVTLVRRLGGRAALLVGRARAPDAFLALGGCYARVGLPQASLAIYREVLHSYGASRPESLALQVAEAALVARDTALARRVLESRDEPARSSAPYRLMLGDVELAEKRPEAAAALFLPLVSSDEEGNDRLRAVVGLARAAAALADPAPYRDALDAGVRALAGTEPGEGRALLGEAAFEAGRLHRRAGDVAGADACLAIALETLPPGPMRAEAAYWRGSHATSPVEAAIALHAATDDTGPWGRLARNVLAIGALHAELDSRGATPPEVAP